MPSAFARMRPRAPSARFPLRPEEAPELLTRPIVRLDVVHGLASYYGNAFDELLAASGMRFDTEAFVAAHRTYPSGSLNRVANMKNGRSVRVPVVDRGPAHGPRSEGVIIDLSQRAAKALDFVGRGRTEVRLDVPRWGP